MRVSIPFIAAAAVFAAQLALCFKAKRLWLRLLPLMLIGAGVIISLLLLLDVFGSGDYLIFPDAHQLVGLVGLFLFGICLAADGAAWLVWLLAKKVSR